MRIPLIAVALSCAAFAQPTDKHASERKAYDEIYAAQPQTFSAEPNAFLVRMITGRKPGRAVDVAMGQGRNALWLAAQGWTVTGFDISPVAIEQARRDAAKRGLKIDAEVTAFEEFDWGSAKWDLVVCSYFFPQSALPKIWESLKPGGLLMIEGFHADTGHIRPIGGGYTDKQMFQALEKFRILQYEDVEDHQEWGQQYGATNRLVRVLAEKPQPPREGCSWQNKDYRTGEAMCWGVGQWTCGVEGWEYSGKCPAQP